jgi:hypothetical protein
MSNPKPHIAANDSANPPALQRDASGRIDSTALANLIEWFINYDERVAVIRHPRVEELFQWKQAQSSGAGEKIFHFDHAEDRLAIGIVQALAAHASESALHDWISQLLNALEDAAKTNEDLSGAYKLETKADSSVIAEAAKIPAPEMREIYLTCCWLEALCTAELRVLGWIYQELYGRAFHPNNV